MSYNLSELFERVAGAIPDRTAVVAVGEEGTRRVTYGELDERATRLANHLRQAGFGAGDHVGLHLLNGSEYLEAMLGAFKLRAVPVNVNYRYVERELEHLYDYMDVKAIIVHRQFAPRVAPLLEGLTKLEHVVVVDDASGAEVPSDWVDYEAALAATEPKGRFDDRSSDDVYATCTGGTTGMPKGVMWRHEDIFFASLGGGDPTTFEGPISSPEQITERILGTGAVFLLTPPLMHVSAHWAAFNALYGGGTVLLPKPGPLVPAEIWALAEAEKANTVIVVGNAMARPLVEHLADHDYDLSSLLAVASGGAILSASTKELLRQHLPNIIVIDGFGSSETGVMGTDSGEARAAGSFKMDATTTVLDDDLRPVEPGSGTIGRLARQGRIPLSYYKDPEKTAATFVEHDGVRWVLPGDLASVEADGSIVVHGRGSVSINTGGEKVFPEEVESALVSHPAVRDVVVVGVPDERWGQRVVAVVEARPGETVVLDDLQAHARAELAGYKLPREVVVVDAVLRSPNGKPDYGWAREQALAKVE
jgi:acyl-CoA synthetase (AMP-forming)/AMP-acid ligase II